jgi:hypothetical protein
MYDYYFPPQTDSWREKLEAALNVPDSAIENRSSTETLSDATASLISTFLNKYDVLKTPSAELKENVRDFVLNKIKQHKNNVSRPHILTMFYQRKVRQKIIESLHLLESNLSTEQNFENFMFALNCCVSLDLPRIPLISINPLNIAEAHSIFSFRGSPPNRLFHPQLRDMLLIQNISIQDIFNGKPTEVCTCPTTRHSIQYVYVDIRGVLLFLNIIKKILEEPERNLTRESRQESLVLLMDPERQELSQTQENML